MTTPSMFSTCPLPGCRNLTDHPATPCDDCLEAFGGWLRPTGHKPDPDVYAAEIAARDQAVRDAIARQQPEPEPEPTPEVEWRRNQKCWVCEERHTCRPDPVIPRLWICRVCTTRIDGTTR